MPPRAAIFLLALLVSGCAPAPQPAASVKKDPTQEAWYSQTVDQLIALNHRAERAFQTGEFEDASDLILKAQPLATRLLDAPQPTLAAVQAASDLDQLYGQMLLTNKNYGWARLEFQKNRARWKSWQPQTPDTARRLKLAEDAIAECDRRMEQ